MKSHFEDGDEAHGSGGRRGRVKVLDSPLSLMLITEIRESDGRVGFMAIDWPAKLSVFWLIEPIESPALDSSSSRDPDWFCGGNSLIRCRGDESEEREERVARGGTYCFDMLLETRESQSK
jgi:hypothetical protein